MSLLQRARDSGICPPSLLSEERVINHDGFETAVARILDMNRLSLGSDTTVPDGFKKVLEMADKVPNIPGNVQTKEVLEQRRCIILTIVGSTDPTSHTLSRVLANGYLTKVKSWLDQILQGTVGSVDLLLHLLGNIKMLPVTKSLVKSSGMGKAIGSIEKHSFCSGSPNEAAISARVGEIKEAWHKSVKAMKDKDSPSDSSGSKRQLEPSVHSPSSAKKTKTAAVSSFSTLLKKVSDSSPTNANAARSNKKPDAGATATNGASLGAVNGKESLQKKVKKPLKRVKWEDHFGGHLNAVRVFDSADNTTTEPEVAITDAQQGSWSDRKRRDRLREKDLLAKMKRTKLLDDENDSEPQKMVTRIAWHPPNLLPENPDASKPALNSKEVAVQIERMMKVTPAKYSAALDVPSSPAPLSDVEQALDMTSQSLAVVGTIPFFVSPQETPAPAAAAPPAPATTTTPYAQPKAIGGASSAAPQPGHAAATAQTVQALDLPMFLVGQNVQALQTLAASPSLLNSLREPNGMYDQPRLLTLVQTLSQGAAPAPPPPPGQLSGFQPTQTSSYTSTTQRSYPPASGGIYGPASTTPSTYGASSSSYGASSSSSPYGSFGGTSGQLAAGGSAAGGRTSGYRGDQNSSDGNLHLSGYGPSTTQSDIIALFSQYVQVDEVVLKGTFAFVNTSDSVGAKRAREALNGALLGGMPVRINMAQRRNRETMSGGGGGGGGTYGPRNPGMKGFQNDAAAPFKKQQQPPPPLGTGGGGADEVRDDRGNPATKNLFVAGYGPGTTEHHLRELFGQYATIVGVITKGTFSFVNTSDKVAAIRCRESLSGTVLNGGVLRINFAKETGRLGTSFDLTYGPGGAPAGSSGGGSHSHYGRQY